MPGIRDHHLHILDRQQKSYRIPPANPDDYDYRLLTGRETALDFRPEYRIIPGLDRVTSRTLRITTFEQRHACLGVRNQSDYMHLAPALVDDTRRPA